MKGEEKHSSLVFCVHFDLSCALYLSSSFALRTCPRKARLGRTKGLFRVQCYVY